MATHDLASLGGRLRDALGDAYVIEGEQADAKFRGDLMGKFLATPALVVRPATTEQVSQIMRIASEFAVPVTPVGGQTGTVGGAVAEPSGIALSLDRMNRIIEIDTTSMTMTVEAGCILQVAQEAAEAEGAFLPLDLGSRGSAMIGGTIAANAGGNRVLRWGMMRDMVSGLEVVLSDGTVVSSLTKMIKDNAGYAWKHLMIGSEGTLGVVTRAVLRLRPLPASDQTALVALSDFASVTRLLRRMEVRLGGRLSSFELMWGSFYSVMTEAQSPDRTPPMTDGYAYYVLLEMLGGDAEGDPEQFEQALGDAIEDGVVEDAIIAKSGRDREAIWAVREDMMLGLEAFKPFMVYDVSMALRDMATIAEDVRDRLLTAYPDARMLFYGHAGDGNLHIIVHLGEDGLSHETAVDTLVFDAVKRVGGSIAAEHGIGRSRARFLDRTRSDSEIELMRRIKHALDPQNILNPGKVLG